MVTALAIGMPISDYSTTITIVAPAGRLGIVFTRAPLGVGCFCTPAADSALKGKVTDKMMLVKVNGADVSGLDIHDISEYLNARADKERTLEFVVDSKDSELITKTVVVKNMGVKRVIAPPGRLGLAMIDAPTPGTHKWNDGGGTFDAPTSGIYCRVNPNMCRPGDGGSPLFPALRTGTYKVLSVMGETKLASAVAATEILVKNKDANRPIVVGKLGGGTPLLATLLEGRGSSGGMMVAALETASPLLGHAAIGAEIVKVKGLDTPTNQGIASLPETCLEITLTTPPLARTRMEFVSFIPLDFQNGNVTFASAFDAIQSRGLIEDDLYGASNLASGRYETVNMMKEVRCPPSPRRPQRHRPRHRLRLPLHHLRCRPSAHVPLRLHRHTPQRMNTFLGTSGLKVTSIETASIDGTIERMNSGCYRSGGGDRAEWVYQTLRVWYNALDPENLRPSCIEAARSHAMPSARAGSVAPARARWRRREAITPAGPRGPAGTRPAVSTPWPCVCPSTRRPVSAHRWLRRTSWPTRRSRRTRGRANAWCCELTRRPAVSARRRRSARVRSSSQAPRLDSSASSAQHLYRLMVSL